MYTLHPLYTKPGHISHGMKQLMIHFIWKNMYFMMRKQEILKLVCIMLIYYISTHSEM